MVLEAGKIYTPASAEEIRDDFLADVRLEARKHATESEVDRATRPGTDNFILATAVGNLGILQYANISKNDNDADVLTATGEALDEKREGLGLPEVPASPATGRIVVSLSPTTATAAFNNHEFVLPNGKRGRVDGVHVGVAHEAELPIVTIDTGADVNLEAGQTVRFVSPPLNVETEAEVSSNAPFTGGADEEDDERKRDRILNRLQNVPAGGNWGFVIEKSLNALATLQYAFVYPALGGPGSVKVTLVRDIDPDRFVFSRSLSAQAQTIVRDVLHAELPDQIEVVVGTATGENVDVAAKVTLPSAAAAGGNGQGWLDASPWPPLDGGDTRVSISSISADGLTATVNASTATSPVAGQTHIAWWSSVDQRFQVRLVTAVSGSSGAWALTLDAPLVDHNNAVAATGDYISPAAVHIVAYGETWQGVMRRLGPGENTSDAYRLPRAKRHPFIDEDWPSDLTIQQLLDLKSAHGEIQNAEWSYRSLTTPTVPASVATNPNILVPRHFGLYQL